MTAHDASAAPAQNIYKAALWMLGWVAALCIMAVSGRELSAEITAFQTLFFRSAIGITMVMIVWVFIGRPSLVSLRMGLHLTRSVLHYFAQWLWFLAIGLLPLAQVISIEFTVPVWTALMAAMFLGEKLTPLRVFAIVLGFLGVLVIVRPGLETFNLATLAIVAAAIGFAVVLTITKTLAGSESAFTLIFYMHLTQFLMGVVPMAFLWITPSWELVPWAAAVGIAGFASHYCLTRAMAEADATVVVPLDFMRLPVMMAVGYVAYQESIDLLVFVGASMILAGNLTNVRTEGRKSRRLKGAPGP